MHFFKKKSGGHLKDYKGNIENKVLGTQQGVYFKELLEAS